MSTQQPAIDKKLAKSLEPLDSLSPDKLDELIAKSTLEELPAGRVLFRQGEKDKRTLYLITGQIELTAHGKLGARTVKAKTGETRKPLVPEFPRSCSARTKTPVTLLSVDSDLLEILLSDGPPAAYEVTELAENDDEGSEWMFRFLQSPAFLALPTENIQALLMRMEEIPARKGEIIVRQGDDDGFYYIIKQGRCLVSRRPAPKSQEIKLATLEAGDGFGEEALITGARRNATVTMAENGVLMRLPKDDFTRLLVTPLLKQVKNEEVSSLVSRGVSLVDVRGPEAFNRDRIPGAVNLPLSVLRLKLAGLDPSRTYLVYCDDGNRAAAAAFLMSQQGLQAMALQGGIPGALRTTDATPSAKPSAPPSSGKPARPSASAPAPAQSTPARAAAGAKADDSGLRRVNAEYAKRMEAAEQARQEAEAHAQRVKADAESARKAAENEAAKLARQGKAQQGEIQAIRLRAEAEAQRAEAAETALRETESTLTRLKVEAEAARQAAERQAAERAAAEAAARRKAEEEAERLRAEAERLTVERTEVEARVRREAEAQAKQLREEAERVMAQRTQAEAAARRKAEEEAERLRAEAERLTAERTEVEARVRREAEAQAKRLREEAERLMAEREAAERRAQQEAEQEAERLRTEARQIIAERTKAEAAARREAEQEAERLRAEAERLMAERVESEARLRREAQAEIEAAARRAAEEAKREAEAQARLLIEEETRRKQSEVEAARQEATAAAELARTAEEARLAAQRETERLREEAEKIRRQAQEEAQRLRAEAEAIREQAARDALRKQQEEARRIQEELEAAQRRAEEEAERARQAEAARHEAEENARHIVSAADERMKKAEQARQLAETIAARLKVVDQRQAQARAQSSAAANTQVKPPPAKPAAPVRNKAKVQHAPDPDDIPPLLRTDASERNDMRSGNTGMRRVDNKIFLEGEEDLFVFIEPKAVGEDFAEPARAPVARRPAPAPAPVQAHDNIDPTVTERGSSAASVAPPPASRPAQTSAAAEKPVAEPTAATLPPPLSDASTSAKGTVASLSSVAPTRGSARQARTADDDARNARPSHRRGLGAIAAGLVLMVGAAFVVSQVPWSHFGSTDKPATEVVSVPASGSETQQTARAAQFTAARSRAKAEVVQEAESEFSQLVNEWRNKLNSVPLFKQPADGQSAPASNGGDGPADSVAPASAEPRAETIPAPASVSPVQATVTPPAATTQETATPAGQNTGNQASIDKNPASPAVVNDTQAANVATAATPAPQAAQPAPVAATTAPAPVASTTPAPAAE